MRGDLLDKAPPNDAEAERWVLGSVILEPSVLDDLGFLHPADFYGEAHQRIYATLLAMRAERAAIDTGLLVERLKRTGQYEAVGGDRAMLEILHAAPVPSHAEHYGRIVARLSALRRLRRMAEMLYRDSQAAQAEPAEIVDAMEKQLAEIMTGAYGDEPVPIAEAIAEATRRIDAMQDRQRTGGIMTGLTAYDEHYGGLFGGELTILAARPGVGKTSLALQIATHNARRGRLTYFASLEMSASELATRILCRQSRVNHRDIRAGRLERDDHVALVRAGNEAASAKLVIHDRPALSVADVRRATRRLTRDGLALVIVDYLQLLTPEDRRIVREQQVSTMTRELKCLARELQVPVLVCCQLNRQADAERPRLSHLRESGAIEQDADSVALLYTHEPNPEEGDHNAILEVAKCRNGEANNQIRLWWNPQTTSFGCHAVVA